MGEHQQFGHTETGHWFQVSSKRPEKRGTEPMNPGLVIIPAIIPYTSAAPTLIVIVFLLL